MMIETIPHTTLYYTTTEHCFVHILHSANNHNISTHCMDETNLLSPGNKDYNMTTSDTYDNNITRMLYAGPYMLHNNSVSVKFQ